MLGDLRQKYYIIHEPKRLESLGENKVSLLAQYGYTQEMAKELCERYSLLSPYYQYSKRGGCWCCPNSSESQLRFLRDNHRELWNKLIELEAEDGLIGNIFNTQANRSIRELEEKFHWESQQMNIFDYL